MKHPAEDEASATPNIESESMRALKHDINNQLSNILLALEQLKYELPSPSEDCIFYINAISISTAKITSILSQAG
jgi:hypothetical protein